MPGDGLIWKQVVLKVRSKLSAAGKGAVLSENVVSHSVPVSVITSA